MRSARILLAAADSARRARHRASLEEAGFRHLFEVATVWEATDAAKTQPLDCAVVDAELRGGTGLEAVQALKSVSPRLRVIFTAPLEDQRLEAEARSLDPFYYHLENGEEQELVAAVREAVGAEAPARPGPRLVLLVDDDTHFLRALRAQLEGLGVEVAQAADLRSGLARARELRPDLVLVDVVMDSYTDGLQLCHELRADPQLRHVRVVAMSALPRPAGLSRLLEGGQADLPIDELLDKPIAQETLRRLLSGAPLEDGGAHGPG